MRCYVLNRLMNKPAKDKATNGYMDQVFPCIGCYLITRKIYERKHFTV